ncbi:MAG: nucleoside hydrolase [Clostridia bacterium]|nr:nucleoside hydrolase [Clostridia bacterium]
MSKKLPIIIDTDPGIDDAIALIMLHKYIDMFDVKLICAVGGNISLDITTKNVQHIAKKFFNGVKIAQGLGEPLYKKLPYSEEEVHGFGGLGNYDIGGKQDYPFEQDAVKAMYEVLMNSKEKITLVTLGPMIDVGKLLRDYPEVKDKIEKIYSMIGSIGGIGNVPQAPWAEFNAYIDPDAFKIVVDSGIPMVINPFEVGNDSRIKKQLFKDMKSNSETQDMIKLMVEGIYERKDPSCISIFDLNTTYGLIRPDLYELIPCDIEVCDSSSETEGKCVLTKNSSGKHCYQVIKNIEECNREIMKDLFSII